MPRNSQEEAERTRHTVIEAAFALASEGGFDSLSFRGVAERAGVSKSGVAGHFSDRAALELAVVEYALADFGEAVWVPNERFRPGSRRLRAVAYSWLAHAEHRGATGGCLLTAASFQFGDRPGEAAELLKNGWRGILAQLADDARIAGLNGAQTVFGMHSAITEAVWMQRLLGDSRGWQIARGRVDALLS